jgi:predicted ester cyclase
MAKAIGFATQYYTLWDITSNTQYGTNVHGQVTSTWDNITYTYLGNLSKDLISAQEKAAIKGCTNLEPDHELYGRNRSFEKTTPKRHIKEGLESSERSELIMICCSNDKENTEEARRMAIDILLKKGYCSMVNGILTVSEHVEAMKQYFSDKEAFMTSIPTTEFLIERNIREDKTLDVTANTRLIFNCQLKSQYYNGYTFYLPLNKKGRGQRIKNKTIELTDFEFQNLTHNDDPYGTWLDTRTNTKFYNEKEAPSFYGYTEITVNEFKIKK